MNIITSVGFRSGPVQRKNSAQFCHKKIGLVRFYHRTYTI
uniref:Uncharacterized protein n=1 Tax=Lepeophtheirus salmonis TaxID=72036 RepID=A0A0K2V989_LEPSM